MNRVVMVRHDGKKGFYDWRDGQIVRSEDDCPITGLVMAERLGLKRAGIDDLSRAWQVTRLQAAVALFSIEDEGADAFVYDTTKWESIAGAGRTKADDDDSPGEDSGAIRRDAMAARIADTPSTKEDLVQAFNVSVRSVEFDLKAIGAVEAGKDGRKILWTMPKDPSDDAKDGPQ